MFSNLRQNSTIYILHKDGKPYIETGSVTAVSAPRPKYPTPGSGGHRGQPLGRQCGGLGIKRGHERRGVVHEVQE